MKMQDGNLTVKKWEQGRLRVSGDGFYLMEGDRPFFWLGDTAWLLFHNLDEDDARIYLRNRREKGFNVIQATLIHKMPEIKGEPEVHETRVSQGTSESSARQDAGSDPEMEPEGGNPLTPEYWRHVDRVLDIAGELGLYMGLLPIWGSFVKEGILNLENVDAYAHFLGKRFRNRPNLIWILGGDVRGDAGYEVFCREAEILKSYNPERLITFHPFGRTSSSLWFQEESWLDMNLFQSGHRRYDQQSLGEWDDNRGREAFFGEDNWKYVERDHSYARKKPTLDGEPSYEGIPQGLHNPHNPCWEEWDVRRYAYWSVFAGAAGHTYGSNAVMQFYRDKSRPGSYGVRETWKEAMHSPGSTQMQYLKNLMESVDFIHGQPMDCLLCYGQKERYHRIAVFAGADYVLCYDYSGDEFLLDLGAYRGMVLDAWWMDPRNGAYSYIASIEGGKKWLASPTARKGASNDWVLVLRKR